MWFFQWIAFPYYIFTAIVNIRVPKVNNRWIIFVVLCTLAYLQEKGSGVILVGSIFVATLLLIRRKGYILDMDWKG